MYMSLTILETHRNCCIVVIHFYSTSHSISLAGEFPTTETDTVSSLHAEALQAIAGKGLAQGPYMAARAGFEPATLPSKDIDSTNAQPRLTYVQFVCSHSHNNEESSEERVT